MVLEQTGRDESRGQILILIAAVVGLAVISSAVLLNTGQQATLDQSEGVSTTAPEGMDLMEDINENIQTSIVKSNRDPSINITSGDLSGQQAQNFSEVVEYHGYQADITINESISGTRLYNDSESELTNSSSENWIVLTNLDQITGGIEVNGSSIDNAKGPLHIETTTHNIFISNGSGNRVEAEVEFKSTGATRTYATNRSHPYIDLGEGSFAGYRFKEYDHTDINRIEIHDGTAAQGNIEFVVTGSVTADSSLTVDSSATFGVVYTAEVHTGRQTLISQDIATHGPTRGDF